MEILKIVGLCLSCFSLGVSLTGLLFTTLNYQKAERKLKRMEEERKTSKWIINDTGVSTVFVCPVCGFAYEEGDPGLKKGCLYCPECGAKNE